MKTLHFSNYAVNRTVPKNKMTLFARKYGSQNFERYAASLETLQKLHALAPDKNVVIETGDFIGAKNYAEVPEHAETHAPESKLIVMKTNDFKRYEPKLTQLDNKWRENCQKLADYWARSERKPEYKLIVKTVGFEQYQPELISLLRR